MCQSSGRPPTSTIGFGRNSVSSRMRVPRPPQSSTTLGLAAVIGQSIGRGAGWRLAGRFSYSSRLPITSVMSVPRASRHRRRWLRGARVVRLAVARGLGRRGRRPALADRPPRARRRDVTVVRADITDEAAWPAPSRPPVPTHACTSPLRAPSCARTSRLLLAANALRPRGSRARWPDAAVRALSPPDRALSTGTVAGPMDEASACAPRRSYGVAKLAGGLLARVVARRHGPRERPPSPVLGLRPRRGSAPARPVRRPGAAGGPAGQLTPASRPATSSHVDDVAEALLDARPAPGIDGLTANVGTGVQTTCATCA